MDAKEWSDFQRDCYALGRGVGETGRSLNEDRFEFARKELPDPPARVLDVGCNDGAFTLELLKKGYDANGIDFKENILKIWNMEDEYDTRFHCVDIDNQFLDWAKQMPPEEPPYDSVLLLEILEHVVHDFDLLQAAMSLLRKGGKVIVSVPLHDNNCKPGDHHIRYYTEMSLAKIMWVAGFDPINVVDGVHSCLATGVKK